MDVKRSFIACQGTGAFKLKTEASDLGVTYNKQMLLEHTILFLVKQTIAENVRSIQKLLIACV